jgi:hypothetical protein
MANKIYQLKYDDDLDQDIHDWLESIPSNRKAERVRHAIRYYLTYHGKELVPALAPPVEAAPKPIVETRKRPTMDLGGSFK